MEIVKKLNLNQVPNTVEPYSMVGAKNIQIDQTGSFIIKEDGLKVEFELDEKEKIVGCIPTNKELVVFTSENNIYRIPDDKPKGWNATPVKSKWEWSGGKIVGDFTYDYKDRLVIVVGEYDADVDVPLKSWIFTDNDSYIAYETAPEIPKYFPNYDIVDDGNLLCGTYTFFVRFQIFEDLYTSWFQITDDIHIVHLFSKDSPSYYNLIDNKTIKNISENFEFKVNKFDKSNKSIKLNLLLENSKFKNYQIGYIIKRDTNTVGRILGTYKSDVSNIDVYDNNFVEEEAIDNFSKQPTQYYNVKSVRVYNGRCYIANYKEFEDNIEIDPFVEVSLNRDKESDIYNSEYKKDEVVNPENPENPDPPVTPENPDEPDDDRYFLKVSVSIDDNSFILNNVEVDEQQKVLNANYFIDRIIKNIKIKHPNNDGDDHTIDLSQSIVIKNKRFYPRIYLAKDNIRYGETIYEGDGTTRKLYKKLSDGEFETSLTSVRFQNTAQINRSSILEFGNSSIPIPFDAIYSDYYIYIIFEAEKHGSFYIYNNGRYENVYYVEPDDDGEIYARDFGKSHAYGKIGIGANVVPKNKVAIKRKPTVFTEVSNINYLNKTLIPYQKYKFYIHFIRPNGSYTLGYPINSDDFYSIKNINYDKPIQTLNFNLVNCSEFENTYIGYFISYASLEQKAYPVISYKNSVYDYTLFSSSNFLYNNEVPSGNRIVKHSVKDLEISNTSLIEPHIVLRKSDYQLTLDSERNVLYSDSVDVYKKDINILYRLTSNKYFGKAYDYVNQNGKYWFYPQYFNKEILFYYTTKFIGTIQSTELKNESGDNVAESLKLKYVDTWNYSNVPYYALNVYKDYEQASVVYVNTEDSAKAIGQRVNKTFFPATLHDFLELKANYQAEPSIMYTNYREQYINDFPNRITRSAVYGSETSRNAFADYDPNDYKDITENRGAIINLVGLGLNFFVHTEYSIYLFNRSPKLTATAQTAIPDVFEVDYQEVPIPSYGGIKKRSHSIITDNGYIWFDMVNKHIFIMNSERQLNILSKDITNLLKALNVKDIAFGMDNKNNRLLISISVNKERIPITISFNFNTLTYISLHDYAISESFNTKSRDYFYSDELKNNTLSVFDKNTFDYSLSCATPIFDSEEIDLEDDTIVYQRYVDIMYNQSYNIEKSLESITYSLFKVLNDIPIIKYTTRNQNESIPYSGYEMIIFTDQTTNGRLNISTENKTINGFDDYRLPHLNKGIWNLNYFRNTVKDEENPKYKPSDEHSLIYGRYFVVRFILPHNVNFKLDNIDFNISQY